MSVRVPPSRQVVEETIALCKKEGRLLPPPTSGKDYANKTVALA
jgi:hypothetical protein